MSDAGRGGLVPPHYPGGMAERSPEEYAEMSRAVEAGRGCVMHTYEVNVTREDKWWMITVPELNGYKDAAGAINLSDTTQARRLSDVPGQARDFICTVTDKAPSEVGVHISRQAAQERFGR